MFNVPGLKRYQMIQNLAKQALSHEPTLLEALRYAKIKHNVLFFVFNHPALKQEFEYKKENVLNALRVAYKQSLREYKQEEIIFREIKAASVYKKDKKQIKKQTMEFTERSKGEFKNLAKNPAVFSKFEEIRKVIEGAKRR